MGRLRVRVVSPERELWSGEGDMVIAKGVEGDVGILPDHAPMLVSLAIHPVRVKAAGQRDQLILVDGGFLHVTPGEDETRVDVLAEHAALPEEIDVEAARARAEDLQRRSEEERTAEVGAELSKALMRARYGGR